MGEICILEETRREMMVCVTEGYHSGPCLTREEVELLNGFMNGRNVRGC